MTAGVLLSVSVTGRDRALESEGDRLLALLRYAREQAEMQTREYGVVAAEEGYAFVTYDARRDEWQVVESDEALRTRKLPEGLQVRLVVEGRPVVLKPLLSEALKADDRKKQRQAAATAEETAATFATAATAGAAGAATGGARASGAAEARKDRNPIQPQLLLFSNGDLSSFEIAVRREGSERTLTVTVATGGKLELQDSDRKAGP